MIELGSAADWVAAIGGLLAVVAASMSWRSSQRMLDLERHRDRNEADRAEREQAELVFVLGAKLPGRAHGEQWAIYIYNGSTKPIYDVSIESRRLDGAKANHPLNLGAVPPGRFVVPSDPKYHWGVLVDLDGPRDEDVELLVKGKGNGMITSVQFSDSARRRWELDGGDELRPMGEA